MKVDIGSKEIQNSVNKVATDSRDQFEAELAEIFGLELHDGISKALKRSHKIFLNRAEYEALKKFSKYLAKALSNA